MLLNIVGSSNAKTKDILWKFIKKFHKEIDPKTLIKESLKAQKLAKAKYSKFYVGAALLDKENQVIYGCNIESAVYPSTLCAERVGIYSALSQGLTKFKITAHVAVADTPVTTVKERNTSTTQVVAAPTKAPIYIAVTKVVVVPTKPPVSAPTAVSNVEVTPSPISGITPTSQPSTPPVSEVDKSSLSEGEPTVCTSGASIEEQKAVLTQIANSQFTGISKTAWQSEFPP